MEGPQMEIHLPRRKAIADFLTAAVAVGMLKPRENMLFRDQTAEQNKRLLRCKKAMELLYMTSTEFFDFFTPSPLSVCSIYTVCPQLWGYFLTPLPLAPSERTSYMEVPKER